MSDEPKPPLLPELTETTKPCPSCYEEINRKAKVCKHCKSDLTWRRHVSVSNTTLALVTALIAVAGTVGPAAKKLFVPNEGRLSAVLIGSTSAGIVMMLTNTGGRPIAVSRAALTKRSNDGKRLFGDFRASPSAVIEPGSNVTAEFSLDYNLLNEPKDPETFLKQPVGMCDYWVNGVQSDGKLIEVRKNNQDCADAILSYHLQSEQLIKYGHVKLEPANVAPQKP